jgi:hypothetical protein
MGLRQVKVKQSSKKAESSNSLASIDEDSLNLFLNLLGGDGGLKAGKDGHDGGIKDFLLAVGKAANGALGGLHLPPRLKAVLPVELRRSGLLLLLWILRSLSTTTRLLEDQQWALLLLAWVLEQVRGRHLQLYEEVSLFNDLGVDRLELFVELCVDYVINSSLIGFSEPGRILLGLFSRFGSFFCGCLSLSRRRCLGSCVIQ